MAFIKKQYLIILGLISILVLFVPELGIIPMMTIIGIPLAYAYWSIPALFVVLVITRYFCALIPFKGKVNVALALIAGGLVLAIPAYFLNGQLLTQARELVAEDRNDLELPVKASVIAVRRKSQYSWSKGAIRCDGFCLHALLTGEADKVLVTQSAEPKNTLNLNEKVTAFSLQSASSCPAVKFTPGHHRLKFATSKDSKQRSANAIEEVKLRISNGDCLISQSALLGEADMIISIHKLARWKRNAELGFGLNTKSISADRLTVHQRAGDEFIEKYRWTGVRYKPFFPLMLPAPLSGYGFEVGMGWWRTERKINISRKYYEKPNWEGFLTKTLGLKLALNGVGTKIKILEKVEKVLDENRAPSPGEWQVFSAYYDRIGIGRNTNMTSADFDIALRMLNNPDFPAPPRLRIISQYVTKQKHDANAQKLAVLLLTRMENGQTWSDELGVDKKKSLSNLGSGIQWLPDEAIKPHFDQFMRVAAIRDVRVHSYRAFQKFGVFGKNAVPELLSLINSGLAGGKKFFRQSSYQHPYIAGLSGMCVAGLDTKSALEPMLQLMKSNQLPFHSSYGDLLVNTLVRIGADPEEVWPYYAAANKNRTRENFDHNVGRARSDRPGCVL